MIQRYSRSAMREIWTEENKLRLWLRIELLASEALFQAGIVPAQDFHRLEQGVEACARDPKALAERARELEKTLNHDVIAFTTAVAEKINDPASRWLHFGLTSSDVIDTAFAVQMVQSADILLTDVKQVREIIAHRAREYKL